MIINDTTDEVWNYIWFWASYYGWIFLVALQILVLFSLMMIKYSNAPVATQKNFRKALLGLVGYPILIIIAWMPVCITGKTYIKTKWEEREICVNVFLYYFYFILDFFQYYYPDSALATDFAIAFNTTLLSTSMGYFFP